MRTVRCLPGGAIKLSAHTGGRAVTFAGEVPGPRGPGIVNVNRRRVAGDSNRMARIRPRETFRTNNVAHGDGRSFYVKQQQFSEE
jgi:hypothetical protein